MMMMMIIMIVVMMIRGKDVDGDGASDNDKWLEQMPLGCWLLVCKSWLELMWKSWLAPSA